MRLSIIAAVSSNGVIGVGGKLPWNIPEDLNYFKNKTSGRPIVMGRKTFESLPGILPGREHFILTRDSKYAVNNSKCHTNNSLLRILKTLRNINMPTSSGNKNEAFIIGGQQIFELSLDLKMVDHMYITYVDKYFDGDTLFPQIPDDFKLVSDVEGNNSSDSLKYYFREYSKNRI